MIERVTHRPSERLDAATIRGEKIVSFKVTLSGAAPHSIAFKTAGLPPMADADYRVFVDGETAARVTVDESTITDAGFDLLGGADTEIVHILAMGIQAE